MYVTGGGAVTAKANPNSLLLRHRSITVSVTASEVRPSEVGSMQKTFPPDLRKKEGSSERERERESERGRISKVREGREGRLQRLCLCVCVNSCVIKRNIPSQHIANAVCFALSGKDLLVGAPCQFS